MAAGEARVANLSLRTEARNGLKTVIGPTPTFGRGD